MLMRNVSRIRARECVRVRTHACERVACMRMRAGDPEQAIPSRRSRAGDPEQDAPSAAQGRPLTGILVMDG
jgi:hypothetical protein